MHKRKIQRKDIRGIYALIIGVGICTAMMLLFSVVMTLVSITTSDPTSLTEVLSLVALLLGGAVSAFINSRLKSEGGFLISLFAALAFVLVLLLIGLIMSGGTLPFKCIANYLCYMGVSALTGFLGSRKRSRRR